MNVLYDEGCQRLLDGLSTYTRRRIGQTERPDVDRIDYLPATPALRQRPPLPGRRSTVGTMTEMYNVPRLTANRHSARRTSCWTDRREAACGRHRTPTRVRTSRGMPRDSLTGRYLRRHQRPRTSVKTTAELS